MNDDKAHLAEALGVSLATLSNWLREGVIDETALASCSSFQQKLLYIEDIRKKSQRLNARANRSQNMGAQLVYLGVLGSLRRRLLEKIVIYYQEKGAVQKLSIKEGVVGLVWAQLKQASFLKEVNLKKKAYACWKKAALKLGIMPSKIETIRDFFNDFMLEAANDDFVGAFYQSVLSIGKRAKAGSFYTPAKLLTSIQVDENQTVYDPCCGSGSILLRVLPQMGNGKGVFASDIDEIALFICYFNLILFYENLEMKAKVFKQDLIEWNTIKALPYFDRIITNPPWGAKLKSSLIEIEKMVGFKTRESSAFALVLALKQLKVGGQLEIFLPESILNIGIHANVRKALLQMPIRCEVFSLGSPFEGVLSKAIRLRIEKREEGDSEWIVSGERYAKERIVAPEYFIPTEYHPCSEAARIVERFDQLDCKRQFTTLKGQAEFGMGIVTGHNQQFLHSLADKGEFDEAILTGKEIEPFRIKPAKWFFQFEPEHFQQTLPRSSYQQTKIVYKFISNKLVCAIDSEGKFLLNSCNFLVPKMVYSLKVIVLLFNSELYQTYFAEKYHTHRVLRHHLENLPLPLLTEEEVAILERFYDESFAGRDDEAFINEKKLYIRRLFDL